MTVRIHTKNISDKATFHQEFEKAMSFPHWYGMNMDAWIDCMSSLGDPKAGLAKVQLEKNENLIIEVLNLDDRSHASHLVRPSPSDDQWQTGGGVLGNEELRTLRQRHVLEDVGGIDALLGRRLKDAGGDKALGCGVLQLGNGRLDAGLEILQC